MQGWDFMKMVYRSETVGTAVTERRVLEKREIPLERC